MPRYAPLVPHVSFRCLSYFPLTAVLSIHVCPLPPARPTYHGLKQRSRRECWGGGRLGGGLGLEGSAM